MHSTPSQVQTPPWTPIALPALFVVYALGAWLLFAPMLQALHGHWTTANDLDAGYLLLAITLYLFWRSGTTTPYSGQAKDAESAAQAANKPANPHTASSPSSRNVKSQIGFGLLFVSLLIVAGLAAITANKSVTLATLVLAFVPLSAAIWGRGILDSALHGSAILVMGTPIWFVLVPTLQALTASAVNWLLLRGRWPIYIEENLIALPSGMLEIAAGCAGLKFLQTALALTLIEGFIARRSWPAMATIAVVAVLLAIVSNWLRVSIITLLALYLSPEHPWVLDHNWVGWLLFAIFFAPLFYWLGGIEFFARPAAANRAGVAALGQRKLPRAMLSATGLLGAGLMCVWALTYAAEGDESLRIGNVQLNAARSQCLPDGEAHPAPAQFVGAQLELDCAIGAGRYMSLRGYVVEAQEQEVINPVNQLLPGTGVLDYDVTNTRDSASAPGLFATRFNRLAYGFYASGEWSSAPEKFKFRALLRPFRPGPVWALVVSEAGPAARSSDSDETQARDQGLVNAFQQITIAISHSGND